MKFTKGDKQIAGVTAIALGLLLVGVMLVPWARHRELEWTAMEVQSPSAHAIEVTVFSYGSDNPVKRAQVLGSSPTPKQIADQWKRLSDQMQRQGVTEQNAHDILARATVPKYSIHERYAVPGEPLWPLRVLPVYLKEHVAWIILLGRWDPAIPLRRIGAGGGEGDRFPGLSYRSFVVEDQPPHQCWVLSAAYQRLSPQQRQECIPENWGLP